MSTVTISSTSFPDFKAANLGSIRTGTCGVTNASTTVTFSTALPSQFRGKGGFQLKLSSTFYYVSRCADDGLSVTLTSAYVGSTNAALAYTLYPSVSLRFFVSHAFKPSGASYIVQSGNKGSRDWYKEYLCTVYQGSVYLPEITLDATTNVPISSQANPVYYPVFYTLAGSNISDLTGFPTGLVVPYTPTTTTWADLAIASNPIYVSRPDNSTLSQTQIQALIDAATAIDVTTRTIAMGSSGGTALDDSALSQDISGNVTAANDLTVGDAFTAVGISDLAGGLPTKTTAQIAALSGSGNGRAIFNSTRKRWERFNTTTTRWEPLHSVTVRLQDCGATPDCVTATGSGSSSSTTFTASTSVFASTDENKEIHILLDNGSMHSTTIADYVSATVVTLGAALPAAATAKTFYFGTDNTTAIASAMTIVNALGGGLVVAETGDYLCDTIVFPKKTTLRGTGMGCCRFLSPATSGQILDSTWPINSSTAVDINIEDLTVVAIHPLNFVAGFADTCGTFITLRRVQFTGTFYDVIGDQTEVSTFEKCRFEGLSLSHYGSLIGSTNPTSDYGDAASIALKWTLTGSPAAAATDGTRWNFQASSAITYYSRALAAGANARGFTVILRGPEVVSGTQTLRVCDGTYRHDLVFSTSGVALNGGTVRPYLQSHYIRLKGAVGGATATLSVNGSDTDTGVAALSPTSLNTCVAFGQISSGSSNVYWNDMMYASSNPLPAAVWLISGDDRTASASGEFTNVIGIFDCQFNRVAFGIADDGGYAHFISGNNFNGTLQDIVIGSAFGVSIVDNAFESSAFDPIRIGGHFLQRSVAVGTPTAIGIRGGQAHHGQQSGAAAVDLRASVMTHIKGVNFPAGASKPPVIRYTAASVNDLRIGDNPTGGCDLLSALPSTSSTRLITDVWDVSAPEAHVYKESSHRYRTIGQTLTVSGNTSLDLSLGSDWVITLNASATITITNADKVSDVKLKIIQGTGGSRVPTFSPTPKWAAASVPAWATTVGHYDFIEFWSDGANLIEKGRNLDIS